LREAVIDTPSGARMPLGDVATLEMAPTPNEIKRENASLRIDVTLNVAGSNLGRMAREVQERVQALKFEPGYHPEFLGQYAMRQTARDHLGWLAAASLLGTIVLLHLDFRSLRLVLLVVLTPPFALIGCVVSTFVGGEGLSVGSLVAFVTVLGIAARNGILLLSLYRNLEQREGENFGPELAMRGGGRTFGAHPHDGVLCRDHAFVTGFQGVMPQARRSNIPWPL